MSALFAADINPTKAGTPGGEIANKLEGKFGGKAGSWLAKGQQAVKSLEKKKVDGFIIPPAVSRLSLSSSIKRKKPDDSGMRQIDGYGRCQSLS